MKHAQISYWNAQGGVEQSYIAKVNPRNWISTQDGIIYFLDNTGAVTFCVPTASLILAKLQEGELSVAK